MGLAASQARLLSITSRMSDNELRSQLINNAKMRLTADTSKVSDEYIDALNKTQLMFTNFDLKGNEVYQDLTFNTLMAYSAYNTQYGIVNNAGQIVVSAGDAGNFEAAGGDIEKFLESYGLKKTTDYFEKMIASEEFNETINSANGESFTKGIGYYDSYGVWQPIDVDPADLQAIYEGEVDSKGISHYGIKENPLAQEYGDYLTLADEYATARDNYKDKVSQRMREWLGGNYDPGDPSNDYPDLTTGTSALGAYGNAEIPDSGVFQVKNHAGAPYEKYKDFESYYGWAMTYAEALATGTVDTVKEKLPSADTQWYIDMLKNFGKLVGFTGDFDIGGASDPNKMLKDYWLPTGTPSVNQPFADVLKYNMQILNAANSGTTTNFYEYITDGPVAYVETDASGNKTIVYPTTSKISNDPASGGTEVQMTGYPGGGIVYYGGSTGTTVNEFVMNDGCTYEPVYVDSAGNLGYPGDGAAYDANPSAFHISTGHPAVIISPKTVTPEDQGNALGYLWSAFRDSIMNNMSEEEFIKNDTVIKTAKEKYLQAATNLANFIYGEGNGEAIVKEMDDIYKVTGILEYLDDPSWVLSTNKHLSDDVIIANGKFDVDWDVTVPSVENGDDPESYPDDKSMDPINKCHTNPFKDYGTTVGSDPGTLMTVQYTPVSGGAFEREYMVNYQVVKDTFILQCMLEHYGEPKYTWIDQNNKDEDGTAKATWYMNLFNRMQQGYTTIDKNVTNSQEWLQFAFESSLVHMEQVNKSSEWVPLMYSNCASITESTADVDITVAEAKYKREMAKIEAKDKQYDIELKNIDTEHESLKQEYESIKTVIDKNIERNMKLFVQG